MPPKPDTFHAIGDVEIPNLGVDVQLVPRNPQGTNHRILLLDLLLVQQPGIWPQVVVWNQVRFDRANVTYDRVEIFFANQQIATIAVDNVQ